MILVTPNSFLVSSTARCLAATADSGSGCNGYTQSPSTINTRLHTCVKKRLTFRKITVTRATRGSVNKQLCLWVCGHSGQCRAFQYSSVHSISILSEGSDDAAVTRRDCHERSAASTSRCPWHETCARSTRTPVQRVHAQVISATSPRWFHDTDTSRRSLLPSALKLPLAKPQTVSRAELLPARCEAPFCSVTAPAAPAQALHLPPAAP